MDAQKLQLSAAGIEAVGAFLTHPAGMAHGPHESRKGAKVLTVQQWQSSDGQFDFEAVEG